MRLDKSQQAGVTGWLCRRECGVLRRPGGTPAPPYAGVPPRLRVPIESIAEPRLLQVILLGFSRDGDHLLCYSSAGPRFRLHVFRFRGRAAAQPLMSVPLFAELREHAPQQARELPALFGAFSKPSASKRNKPRDARAARRRRRPRGAAAHHDVRDGGQRFPGCAAAAAGTAPAPRR